ncbi:MAG: hypothetical protein HY246_07180, partial [Proteobacteria bacterium]|nr:hypothetical protein [Pseudomonadota bacterium]
FHHLYWRLLDESCAGYDPADRATMGNPILTIYQALDAELGRLMAALPAWISYRRPVSGELRR